jgi:hypothetical protein
MQENAAAEGVALDDSLMQALEALINQNTVSGERYDPQATSEVDTEHA